MTDEEADALAVEKLSYLFKAERIPRIIRQFLGGFGNRSALELIKEGRIEFVREYYDHALHYQS